MKCRDGFEGTKQINVPDFMIKEVVRKKEALDSFYITHIGYSLKADYQYSERKYACNDFILVYCLYGKGLIENLYGEMELIANQFIIIPSNEFHNLRASLNDPWSIYWVYFNTNQPAEIKQAFNLEAYYAPNPICYNEQILDIWHQMYECLGSGHTTFSILNANLCLSRFLCFFLFQHELLVHEKKDAIEKSIHYMKANIHKRLSVDEIASHIQYSPSHYTALFKKKTGMTPMDYFIKMKIRYACKLLKDYKIKIKEIAYKTGYDDPYFFSKLFKQVTGKSPREYRGELLIANGL